MSALILTPRRPLAHMPPHPAPRLRIAPPAGLAEWQSARRREIDHELARLRADLRPLRREACGWSDAPTQCGRCGAHVTPPRRLCARCDLVLADGLIRAQAGRR